ncbi:MAG TPA: fumarylacetoacetate hydrolase family protein [Chitinophagaceae bacterium]|nr:fumarylacetoacetate hydrolase family protein [Chitinophagaceae bacterium]
MKLLYYKEENKFLPGILTPKGVIAINQLAAYSNKKEKLASPLTIDDLAACQKIIAEIPDQSAVFVSESNLEIGPCVPYPPKIICIGLNYRKHAIESGMEIPMVPILFTKYNNTLVAYGNDIPLGPEGSQFDYEVELGVVIGKKCKNISREEALKYVLGYCTANDLSCRDLQFKTSQWLLGKSLDHFLPLGKFMVSADEAGDPQTLQLTCTLNGELRQNSNTADMIFSVAEIIEYLSRHMTLEPGDLILTGTPEGVIMGLPEKNWLKPGDIVKVEIDKLGSSTNKMV